MSRIILKFEKKYDFSKILSGDEIYYTEPPYKKFPLTKPQKIYIIILHLMHLGDDNGKTPFYSFIHY